MKATDDVLDDYVSAETTEAAEQALDALAAGAVPLPAPLGDLYDELAKMAAEEDDYETAARLERKAVESGCSRPLLARKMLGWYLLVAGDVEEGEAVFDELRAERPDDAKVPHRPRHARAQAGLQERALRGFDDALAVAKRVGFQHDIERARSERRSEREFVGLEPDEDARLAPSVVPLRCCGAA